MPLPSSNPKDAAPVTIGIPCYNAVQWIEACVQSALGQDWQNKEVIVVDDGSTDGSLDILQKFGSAITLVQTQHQGANHARNEVLQRASGEWVQYLDADDYLQSGKISKQFAESPDADVIYSPVWMEDTLAGTREPSAIDLQYDIYMQWFSWQMPQTGGCLWKKSVLDALNGWNEAMPCCQEHELYMRALKGGVRFSYAPTPNAVYRIWSNDTLCRRDLRLVIRVRTGLMDELRTWMQGCNLWDARHNAVAAQAFFEMSRTLANYDMTEASAYHEGRKKLSLINLHGPAAPIFYRLCYQMLGFTGAEKLARALR